MYNCYVVLREGPQMNADKRRFTAVFFVMRGGEISEFGDGRRVFNFCNYMFKQWRRIAESEPTNMKQSNELN